jgi:4-hydroxybenzoate polyprenyltransferase
MAEHSNRLPIVIDLDGSLIKTDLLFESATALLVRKKWPIIKLIQWLLKGKAYLKHQLASEVDIDVAVLPYNQGVLLWIQQKKTEGHLIILATASHERYAKKIVEHLGVFDDYIASSEQVNLKGHHKAQALIGRYGDKQFEYLGNDESDLAIWVHSSKAHVVSSSSSFIQKIASQAALGECFSTEKKSFFRALKRELRLYQWVKNSLIFLPLLAAHKVTDLTLLNHALIGFLCFSFTASSAYIINDLVDIENDRYHITKKNRPFASGDLNIGLGWMLFPVLMMSAFVIAYLFLPIKFLSVLMAYFFITLCYSFKFKKILMLDVLILAGLYTLRIVAGGNAVNIDPSFWLQGVSLFMFLSLAFIKRYSELKVSIKKENNAKIKGRGYTQEDLSMVANLGTASGYISVMVLGLYIQDPSLLKLYSNPKMIGLACPILLYWISRSWFIAHRGEMHEDPIIYALKDKVSLFSLTLIILIFLVAS